MVQAYNFSIQSSISLVRGKIQMDQKLAFIFHDHQIFLALLIIEFLLYAKQMITVESEGGFSLSLHSHTVLAVNPTFE